jgi:hypothetical protein
MYKESQSCEIAVLVYSCDLFPQKPRNFFKFGIDNIPGGRSVGTFCSRIQATEFNLKNQGPSNILLSDCLPTIIQLLRLCLLLR